MCRRAQANDLQFILPTLYGDSIQVKNIFTSYTRIESWAPRQINEMIVQKFENETSLVIIIEVLEKRCIELYHCLFFL